MCRPGRRCLSQQDRRGHAKYALWQVYRSRGANADDITSRVDELCSVHRYAEPEFDDAERVLAEAVIGLRSQIPDDVPRKQRTVIDASLDKLRWSGTDGHMLYALSELGRRTGEDNDRDIAMAGEVADAEMERYDADEEEDDDDQEPVSVDRTAFAQPRPAQPRPAGAGAGTGNACPRCDGRGFDQYRHEEDCLACEGTGAQRSAAQPSAAALERDATLVIASTVGAQLTTAKPAPAGAATVRIGTLDYTLDTSGVEPGGRTLARVRDRKGVEVAWVRRNDSGEISLFAPSARMKKPDALDAIRAHYADVSV